MRRLITGLLLLLACATSVTAQGIDLYRPITPGSWINNSTGVARGPILLPDGSAAAPALAFANDPDTGLYSIGANSLGFTTAGSSRGYIGSAGNWVILPAALGGTSNASGLSFLQTLNTTGVIDGVRRMAITATAYGAGSYADAIYAGAAGTTRIFSVDMTGSGYFAGNSYVASGKVFGVGASAGCTGTPTAATGGIATTCTGPEASPDNLLALIQQLATRIAALEAQLGKQ